MACQDDQLYDGLKAGIDDAVHRVHDIWDKSLTTEVWEFLLVEAKNASNEINQVGILQTVQHLWPSGACFVFNYYRHWSSIVLRNGNGTASFMNSREGVIQVEPLAMIRYWHPPTYQEPQTGDT